MALIETTQQHDVGLVQIEALMAARQYNQDELTVAERTDLRAELSGSLSIIQDYLREQATELVVDVSDIAYPGERLKTVMADYGTDDRRQLVVPRSCVTAITLNALWGEADCNPVADCRIVTEVDRDNPVMIYGKGPAEVLGGWSRFPLGELVL